MKNINIRKVLLGLSLLGATTLAGIATPAQAKPRDRDNRQDVKQARKEVKRARKDVRRATSAEDRRDAREDLRDARGDLREERMENRKRPRYNRSTYGRPGYGRRGYQSRTLEGVVLADLRGNDFTIRTNSGQIVRVLALGGESSSISRGDIVRVSGNYSGSSFNARTVSILQNR